MKLKGGKKKIRHTKKKNKKKKPFLSSCLIYYCTPGMKLHNYAYCFLGQFL